MRRAGEGVAFGGASASLLRAALHCGPARRARRIEARLDSGPDRGGHLVFGLRRVDDDAALRFGRGDGEKRPAQRFVKGEPLRSKRSAAPSRRRAAARARPASGEIEDQGEIGLIRADRKPLEAAIKPDRQIARRALVGAGRIGEAVADDPGPARSAGGIVSSRWSMRAAVNSSACPSAPKSAAKPERMASRRASAPGEPPGSRVRTTSSPAASASPRGAGPGPICRRPRRPRA